MGQPNEPQIYDDVFDALDLPDADELRARVSLAAVLTKEIRVREWTQTRAAQHFGIAQADVSRLMRGNVSGYSQERLERLLNALDFHVKLMVLRAGPGQEHERAGVSVVNMATTA